MWRRVDLVVSPVPRHPTSELSDSVKQVSKEFSQMPGTWPYDCDDSDLGITHEYGEVAAQDVVSTFPGIDGGDGNPKPVTVRKPLP